MTTTQAIIKINGFGTHLSDYMQAEALSSLKINDAESEATVSMLAGGETVTKTMLKPSEPTAIQVNSGNLKKFDAALYRALSSSGDIGSGGSVTVGLETTTYNKVTVNNPLGSVGNSGEMNEVTLTFSGSGKR